MSALRYDARASSDVPGVALAAGHDDLAAAGGFRLVAGMVGASHDFVDRSTARADRGHADAGADPAGFAVMLEAEIADGSDDRPGDFFADAADAVLEDDCELVAAEPRHQIVGTHHRLDRRRPLA